jgi:DNA-directed RNA polymerase subunit RPC12/RpoP
MIKQTHKVSPYYFSGRYDNAAHFLWCKTCKEAATRCFDCGKLRHSSQVNDLHKCPDCSDTRPITRVVLPREKASKGPPKSRKRSRVVIGSPSDDSPRKPRYGAIDWRVWVERHIRRLSRVAMVGSYLKALCPRCGREKLERKKIQVKCNHCQWKIDTKIG